MAKPFFQDQLKHIFNYMKHIFIGLGLSLISSLITHLKYYLFVAYLFMASFNQISITGRKKIFTKFIINIGTYHMNTVDSVKLTT